MEKVEKVLRHHGISDLITGERTRPEETEEQKLKDFKKGDTLAQVLIVNALEDSLVQLTATFDSAQEMWQKLLSKYEQSSSQRLDRTMEVFFTSSITDGEDLIKYISRLQLNFREVNDELKKHEASELLELVLMSRIMSTLPKEFFEFKSVWESIPVKDRSVDLLIERIRLIESRLPRSMNSDNGQALQVSRNSTSSFSEGKRHSVKKKIKCFICKGPHYASQCPKKSEKQYKNKIEPRKGNSGPFLCFVAKEHKKDNFIADSGASQHMCFRRDFFHTYQRFTSPINVTVGNGDDIEAVGEGSIRISVNIGKNRYITTLENVWYIPELGRNLMSVSTTVKKGFSFKVTKEKCVFMKNNVAQLYGHCVNGLYEVEMVSSK
ncbi:uncharacterized protein LOC128982478 [Macrosteles quadrilineatus]|uniref:uncharacterized protein LOC128982478 n=1 Tax=Macrosteles quadrilineatus TaxID=74068 RepID=UPI0023E176C0|nr:uncharacterized protein LOC128982478 [Macrosteles quadrilineatus]